MSQRAGTASETARQPFTAYDISDSKERESPQIHDPNHCLFFSTYFVTTKSYQDSLLDLIWRVVCWSHLPQRLWCQIGIQLPRIQSPTELFLLSILDSVLAEDPHVFVILPDSNGNIGVRKKLLQVFCRLLSKANKVRKEILDESLDQSKRTGMA